MIEEITWDTFDERTRIWMRVLSNIPVEAVVRMLRLDLNTGVVTLHGAGGDRVLGVIGEDDAGALRVDDEGVMWDEVPIASFTDTPLKRGDVEKGLGAFVEYATDRLERSLLRAIVLKSLDLVMRAGVDTATAQILSPRTAAIDAPKGRLIIRVDGGTGRVTRLGIEVDPYVTAEIASYGVRYSSLMDYHKTIDEVTGR